MKTHRRTTIPNFQGWQFKKINNSDPIQQIRLSLRLKNNCTIKKYETSLRLTWKEAVATINKDTHHGPSNSPHLTSPCLLVVPNTIFIVFLLKARAE